MRALLGFAVAVVILTSVSGPAEAGKSRSLHAGGFFSSPGATRPFGSGHPTFSLSPREDQRNALRARVPTNPRAVRKRNAC
jgi:hypothetical protein